MKIAIFGSTGMVGKEIVQQALLMGYEVNAFGRNVYSAKFAENKSLHLFPGALFDGGQVYTALKGCDAVVSALGGGIQGVDKTRSLGMKNIVAQMEKAGVQRIVAVGGMGILETDTGTLLYEEENFPPEYVPVSIEHDKALEFLKNSNLEWTMVCPPMITDKDATGKFKTEANQMPINQKNFIQKGDLALFMLKEMADRAFVRQKVGIVN